MSAKEMFKKLGYSELIKHKSYMFYIKPLKIETFEDEPFYENDEIHLEFNFNEKSVNKTYGDDNTSCNITMEELQAINKQVEELGWDK